MIWEKDFPVRVAKLLLILEDLEANQRKLAREAPMYQVTLSKVFEGKAEAYRLLKPLVEALLEDE